MKKKYHKIYEFTYKKDKPVSHSSKWFYLISILGRGIYMLIVLVLITSSLSHTSML